MAKNIVLIGFMGTGKTTIGKNISRNLKWKFMDSDIHLEVKHNMKIKDIFDNYGEDYFREIERVAIKEISEKSTSIISTGGGIVLDEKNIVNLKNNGTIYLLNGGLTTIERNLIIGRENRPLLKNKNWKEKIRELLEFRKDLYLNSADYIIDIDNRTPSGISNEIIEKHLHKQ